MRVFEGVRVVLSLLIVLFNLCQFFVLGHSCSLLPLFARELTSLNHALLLLGLLELSFLLRILLLLLKLGLCCRCCLGLKLFQLLLFLSELHLCFLFFDDSLDFGLLHGAEVGDDGAVAH